MNIVTVLNKLKAANMVANSEENLALFSDCFTKFGISLLLLNDENAFSAIVDLLVENKIPLQKSNGIYNFRVFAVAETELKRTIAAFKDMGELDFLRQYPEMLAAPNSIKIVINNMKKIAQSSYKKGNEYNLSVLMMNLDEKETSSSLDSVSSFLQTILLDKNLISKVVNNISNPQEDDFNVSVELQKVENKICEEFLFPINDEWKIIIDQKVVNSYSTIKETINKITELNLNVNFHDALLFVLFYKSKLSVEEIKSIIDNHFRGGM